MLTEVVANGVIIFVAFWILWFKLNVVWKLRLLNHILLVDICVFVLLYMMYGGTEMGLLSSSLATIAISIALSWAKRRYGYIKGDTYHHEDARVNLKPEIREYYQRKANAKRNP